MANTKHDPRRSQKQISRILSNNPSSQCHSQCNSQCHPAPQHIAATFGGDNDCHDTLNTDSQIRQFRDFLSQVVSRYESNVREQEEAERQETDIQHAIELADRLTEKERRMLFSRMRKCLKVRRACKSENEILQPVYDYVRDRALYDRLGSIQGQVKTKKDLIAGRIYVCRTSVLDGFRAEQAPT